jgi:quinol monooxygenase YgiN
MPILEIRRDSGYADRIRAYEVWVDDAAVGKIRDGEVKQFTVSSGDHELRIKIDWRGP